MPLLVQRTSGKENVSLSDFFTCFGRVDDRKVRALTVIMKSWKRAYFKDAPQREVLLFPFQYALTLPICFANGFNCDRDNYFAGIFGQNIPAQDCEKATFG